jgi:hypothetical protein
MNAPNTPHWSPNSCFGAFRTVPLLHELWCKTGRTGAINAQVRAMLTHQNFLQQNTPDARHSTPNTCFGSLRIVPLLDKLQCKTGQTGAINAQVRGTKSRRNFSKRTHAIHSIGPKTHVSRHFGQFHYCTNFGANRAELGSLMHKFVRRCRVGFFHNEFPKYTPLDLRLMFMGVRDHSITARTSVQNGPNWCHQCTNSSHAVASEYFATNAPDRAHGTQTHILGRFGLFYYCTNIGANRAELGSLMHKFVQRCRI